MGQLIQNQPATILSKDKEALLEIDRLLLESKYLDSEISKVNRILPESGFSSKAQSAFPRLPVSPVDSQKLQDVADLKNLNPKILPQNLAEHPAKNLPNPDLSLIQTNNLLQQQDAKHDQSNLPGKDPYEKVITLSNKQPLTLSFENSPNKNQISSIIPTIIFACNRVTVNLALDKLLIARSHYPTFNLPLIVSQDTCDSQETKNVILKYVQENDHVYYLEQTDRSDPAPELTVKQKKTQLGYYKLARHYKSGINSLFNNFEEVTKNVYAGKLAMGNQEIQNIIIMEDDLEVSEDFYSFMIAGKKVMEKNERVYCVSAWNDNGKPDFIDTSANAIYWLWVWSSKF